MQYGQAVEWSYDFPGIVEFARLTKGLVETVVTTAFTPGLIDSICAIWASITSRTLTCFVAIRPASSVAVNRQSSLLVSVFGALISWSDGFD